MRPPPTYEELKNLYMTFRQNLPKDEFERWLEEYRYTDHLLNLIQEEYDKSKCSLKKEIMEYRFQLKKEIREYQNAKNKAAKELRKFGFRG